MKQRIQSTKLSELATYLYRYTQTAAEKNLVTTPIESLSIRRSDPMKQPMQCLIKPALCMTVQGSKYATFGIMRELCYWLLKSPSGADTLLDADHRDKSESVSSMACIRRECIRRFRTKADYMSLHYSA